MIVLGLCKLLDNSTVYLKSKDFYEQISDSDIRSSSGANEHINNQTKNS